MKRVFQLLVLMSVMYVFIQFGFKFIEKGHKIQYTVKTDENKFLINEVLTVNDKNEIDNYYLEMTLNNTTFDYQTFYNFNMQSKIIEDIKYYKDDNYECILPIFSNNKILSDIICKKNDTYYNYYSLRNTNTGLDNFANSLQNVGYNYLNYEDNKQRLANQNSLIVYNNISDNHYLALESYKGLYTINTSNRDKIYKIDIFDVDIYNKPLSIYVDNYYLVADYTKQYKFNKFILIDITNDSKTEIVYDYDISMDSYIQGAIDKNVYLYDNSTRKQYEISIKQKTIIEIGNPTVGYKKYINNEFQTVSTNNDKYKFTEYTTDNIWNNNNYLKVDKTGKLKSGYYYIYEKKGNKYNLYRSNIQNGKTKTYLFSTDNIDNIFYFEDYIYYRYGNTVYRYSDNMGIKTILSDNELGFNNSLKFGAYQK